MFLPQAAVPVLDGLNGRVLERHKHNTAVRNFEEQVEEQV